jgi:heat shock protein HslJ
MNRMKKMLMLAGLVLSFTLVAYSQQRGPALHGSWKLVSGSGNLGPISEDHPAELNFENQGNTLTGFTGCNRLTGEYKVERDQLTLGPLILTKKACDNMELEMLVQRFLPNVGFYKVEQDRLYLYDKVNRKRFLVFTRVTGTI